MGICLDKNQTENIKNIKKPLIVEKKNEKLIEEEEKKNHILLFNQNKSNKSKESIDFLINEIELDKTKMDNLFKNIIENMDKIKKDKKINYEYISF